MRAQRIFRAAAIVTALAGASLLLTSCTPSHSGAHGTDAPKPVDATAPKSATPVAGPTLRVPTTCESLASAAETSGALGATLVPVDRRRTLSPGSFADARAGALECEWAPPGTDPWGPDAVLYTKPLVFMTVVPGTTQHEYDLVRGIGADANHPEYGPNAFALCTFMCSFSNLHGAYALSIWVGDGQTAVISDKVRSAAATLFVKANSVVASLAPPASLWMPPAGSLKGVTGITGKPDSCASFASNADVAKALHANTVRVGNIDFGENSTSTFNSARQSGAFWCGWSGDGADGMNVSVLPGGAQYFDTAWAKGAAGLSVSSVDGLGERAFVGTRAVGSGSEITLGIKSAGGWLQIVATGSASSVDDVKAFAAGVLKTLGTSELTTFEWMRPSVSLT